jgi:hypothetical protein
MRRRARGRALGRRYGRAAATNRAFHAALFLRDGSIVEANVNAATKEEAVSVLTAVGARFLSLSYDALRHEIEEALVGKGSATSLPYVTLNKNTPAPHVSKGL